MKASAQLTSARALLAGPNAWTQRAYGRDSAGEALAKGDRDAVCWCLSGALAHVGVYSYDLAYQFVRQIVGGLIGKACLLTFNDMSGCTQAQVLSVLDRSIALAEAEGA